MTGANGSSVLFAERDLIAVPDIAPTASKQVCIRLTPAEYARFAARAATAGMTVPGLIRACASMVLDMDESHADV